MNSYAIRTATKAIIIKDDKILLNKYKKNDVYYTLPGGGQDHNEELPANLKRECMEELGIDIDVHDVLFVREFIADRHNPGEKRKGYHQVNIIFECSVINENAGDAHNQDPNQIGGEWVPVEKLEEYALYPYSIRKDIIRYWQGKNDRIYLGETD